jgi:prophage maintenance system killer protein
MNEGALESALGRIQNKRMYDDLDDVFEIAGMYAEAQTSAPHLCPRFPIWQSKDF